MHAFKRYVIPFTDTMETIKRFIYFWNTEKSVQQHLNTVNEFAYKVIKERREKDSLSHDDEKNESGGGDILHHFMTAKNLDGNLLSDEELRDTIMNFIIAGRDTTAQALSWTFYNLMLYPEIEEKVYQEVCSYITDEVELDPPKLYEVVQNMVYSHAVYVKAVIIQLKRILRSTFII
jgi:cytochrome P450